MEWFGLILFIAMVGCCVIWFIQSSRLFYMFRNRYPDIARKKISNAFTIYADPDKFLFFFYKKNIPLLQQDKEVWRLRQQVKILTLISFGIPLGIMLIGAICIVLVGC